ncbi:Phosphate regulon transcriptional regulatory protein PhoB (SphR) [Myxococcus hansupus]|uniref:Phosphate regulon transcriptional regulatory protein PhoB (SphR) n=1 Tax=Pseudomyxococcus hansupus TaxID=1297742 RepID=A0A0H4WKX2_9BACT|nr:Phosphate regulon transcriptional regulatory protein PhoB (SphR) [Myxococcus hansupus]
MRPTILLVEDEPDLREMLAELLELSDYQVVQAANGQVALDLLGTMPRPTLILLDLMMPVMDGHELVRHLRADARYQGVPVLMLTAHFSVEAPEGTVGLLRKPVDIAELLTAMAPHCAVS